MNRCHSAALKRSTGPSRSVLSRTARPPSGSAATSTQLSPSPPEYEDFTQLKLSIFLAPKLGYEFDGFRRAAAQMLV